MMDQAKCVWINTENIINLLLVNLLMLFRLITPIMTKPRYVVESCIHAAYSCKYALLKSLQTKERS